MIDLHSHSRASDGSYTQRDLVAHAAEAGISTLALTDHDSVSGNAEAAHAALSLGIGFLPGVELDIEWKPGECHLLGYGIGSCPSEVIPDAVSGTMPRRSYGDLRAPEGLAALLVRLNEDRRDRNREIVAKMREGGIDIDLERVEALAGGGTVGRPHFAQFLVEAKVVKNRQQAFDRYLAKDRPYFIDRKSIPLDEAIEAIRAAGGVPVLAHPLSLYVSWGHLEGILANFRDRGIAGIEAWHPAARIVDCERLERAAAALGLFVTAGSDFHGAARPDRKIGRTAGRRPIDDRFLPPELEPYVIRPV
jgi:predicted metal-dependent phosphoesterase TrpH